MFTLSMMLMSFAAGFAACKYWPQAKPMVVQEIQKVEDQIKGGEK